MSCTPASSLSCAQLSLTIPAHMSCCTSHPCGQLHSQNTHCCKHLADKAVVAQEPASAAGDMSAAPNASAAKASAAKASAAKAAVVPSERPLKRVRVASLKAQEAEASNSLLPGSRHRAGSSNSGPDTFRQADSELAMSVKKVDELHEQIKELLDRRQDVDGRLLRHTAAVLAEEANRVAEKGCLCSLICREP